PPRRCPAHFPPRPPHPQRDGHQPRAHTTPPQKLRAHARPSKKRECVKGSSAALWAHQLLIEVRRESRRPVSIRSRPPLKRLPYQFLEAIVIVVLASRLGHDV